MNSLKFITIGLSLTFIVTMYNPFLIIGFILIIIGLVFTSRGGLYWLDIVDHWINNYGLVSIGLAEVIVIGFIFGTKPFREYLNEVSEIKVGIWWDIMIKYVTPLMLGITIITSLYVEFTEAYEGYPTWAIIIGGWAVVGAIVIAAITLAKAKGSVIRD